MEYEQMEFDTMLESERELKENINVAVSFACKQVQRSEQYKVTNRHEGYGIAAESHAAIQGSVKKVSEGMKYFLNVLPADDNAAISAANTIYNAAVDLVYQATMLAAQANRVMTDLYELHKDDKSPLEEYADAQEDGEGFEEAQEEDQPEAEDEEGDDE
nr:hypothetical protein [uncultured Dysosmobacter sp.]